MSMRMPIVAGKFYEANKEALCNYVQSTVDDALNKQVKNKNSAHAKLVLLPHAGHFFCGHVIAQTLSCVELPDTLILLGPNHAGKGENLAVWHEGFWQTPLGAIAVDDAIARQILQSNGGFVADQKAHVFEHSLEVILPFLQHKLPDLRIVPISIGGRDLNLLKTAGQALGEAIAKLENQGQQVAIIVSSDLHHFSDHNTTLSLDRLALNAFMKFDPQVLAQVVAKNKISMCGVCPAIVSLYALKKLGKEFSCELINHTTSYEMSQDASRVVGYAGLFVKENTCKKQ